MSQPDRQLPRELYTAAQTRLLDQIAIEGGTPGFRLMQRAAQSAFHALLRRWPTVRRLTLLCGAGNNGGDGLVMAVLAARQGITVQLLTLGSDYASRLQGEALEAWQLLQASGIQVTDWSDGVALTGELVVDAMLGTGLSGAVRSDYAHAIEQLNRSGLPVIAVDIPSGLCADTGAVLGQAVRADMTVTFIGMKRGLLTHQAVDYTGELQFDSLRVSEEVYGQVPADLLRTDHSCLQAQLEARPRSSHKGRNGRVLVIGGDQGMGGAALIAAQAAARCGAGLVTLGTRAEHVTASLVRCPEVMVRALEAGDALQSLLDTVDVVVIGPGLGQARWGTEMLSQVVQAGLPMVLDADALNLLASAEALAGMQCNHWVLTPHPGEAARLLDESIATLQSDRFAAVTRLQQRYGGVALLKGPGTLVDDGVTQSLCSAGNPGMASGGMGDLLSGIIGALIGQGVAPAEAARLAAYLHGRAGDAVASRQGERGMLATDLLPELPRLLNGSDNR